MTTNSLQPDDTSARLGLALSRGSLVTALMIFATTALYLGIGFTAADNALGPEYAELMQAVRGPGFYRLSTLSETFHWLLLGGMLLIWAGLFARRAPIRAAVMAACGLAQLAGSSASLMRLIGISDLAGHYATVAPAQQMALLQSFLDLGRVIQPLYAASTLLQGAGLLLVTWVAWRSGGVPRWLALWLAIAGLFGLALFMLRAAGSPGSLLLPVILLDVIVLFGLHVALAVTFWRPSPRLLAQAVTAAA
jgi:hypothetical protein